MQEWRSSPSLTSAARKLQKNDTFQRMLEVLKNELPTNRTLPLMGTKEPDFIYAYGVEVGYRNCLAVLEALSEPLPKQTEPVSDFSDENDD